jgi:hypothetical protein
MFTKKKGAENQNRYKKSRDYNDRSFTAATSNRGKMVFSSFSTKQGYAESSQNEPKKSYLKNLYSNSKRKCKNYKPKASNTCHSFKETEEKEKSIKEISKFAKYLNPSKMTQVVHHKKNFPKSFVPHLHQIQNRADCSKTQFVDEGYFGCSANIPLTSRTHKSKNLESSSAMKSTRAADQPYSGQIHKISGKKVEAKKIKKITKSFCY